MIKISEIPSCISNFFKSKLNFIFSIMTPVNRRLHTTHVAAKNFFVFNFWIHKKSVDKKNLKRSVNHEEIYKQ
ncbi:unnamed protein product [Chironomus riparius]|uniref:Uncharacterized protein n=1 Tax=Chironomus riparius TaxID=315576 RepID=A0A9N9WR41_9DIPT|nr:unnamed protein product [Chironomus riparius]